MYQCKRYIARQTSRYFRIGSSPAIRNSARAIGVQTPKIVDKKGIGIVVSIHHSHDNTQNHNFFTQALSDLSSIFERMFSICSISLRFQALLLTLSQILSWTSYRRSGIRCCILSELYVLLFFHSLFF